MEKAKLFAISICLLAVGNAQLHPAMRSRYGGGGTSYRQPSSYGGAGGAGRVVSSSGGSRYGGGGGTRVVGGATSGGRRIMGSGGGSVGGGSRYMSSPGGRVMTSGGGGAGGSRIMSSGGGSRYGGSTSGGASRYSSGSRSPYHKKRPVALPGFFNIQPQQTFNRQSLPLLHTSQSQPHHQYPPVANIRPLVVNQQPQPMQQSIDSSLVDGVRDKLNSQVSVMSNFANSVNPYKSRLMLGESGEEKQHGGKDSEEFPFDFHFHRTHPNEDDSTPIRLLRIASLGKAVRLAQCGQRTFATTETEIPHVACCHDRAFNTKQLLCRRGKIVRKVIPTTSAPTPTTTTTTPAPTTTTTTQAPTTSTMAPTTRAIDIPTFSFQHPKLFNQNWQPSQQSSAVSKGLEGAANNWPFSFNNYESYVEEEGTNEEPNPFALLPPKSQSVMNKNLVGDHTDEFISSSSFPSLTNEQLQELKRRYEQILELESQKDISEKEVEPKTYEEIEENPSQNYMSISEINTNQALIDQFLQQQEYEDSDNQSPFSFHQQSPDETDGAPIQLPFQNNIALERTEPNVDEQASFIGYTASGTYTLRCGDQLWQTSEEPTFFTCCGNTLTDVRDAQCDENNMSTPYLISYVEEGGDKISPQQK